jgi:hypothetical protein
LQALIAHDDASLEKQSVAPDRPEDMERIHNDVAGDYKVILALTAQEMLDKHIAEKPAYACWVFTP